MNSLNKYCCIITLCINSTGLVSVPRRPSLAVKRDNFHNAYSSIRINPRGKLASVFHKHAETAAHNWPHWLCENTSKSLFFSWRKTGGVKWEEMKLPTVLVISICSSSLTYSSGRQLALGNAASSFAKKKKKKVAASNAIARLTALIFTPIVYHESQLVRWLRHWKGINVLS